MIRATIAVSASRSHSAAHAGELPRESRVPGGIAFVEIPGGDWRRRR